MSLLDILTYPDPVLKRPSRPVTGNLRDLEKLVKDMFETMYNAPGVGLAAPQVGRNIRLFVVDVSSHQEEAQPMVFVNPELLQGEGELIWEEGCLSVPEMMVEVPRMERVRMAGQDLSGRRFEVEARGLLAIALQHELDHLDGRLIIDRVSSIKRELYRRRRLREAARALA
jgi:peptide deformylase